MSMVQKEEVKQLIQLLIMLGTGKQINLNRNSVMGIIHSREFLILIKPLSEENLIATIKGLCLLEGLEDMQFGSTTQVPKLLKMLEIRFPQDFTEIINWLFINRSNSYVPYGTSVSLEVKSLLEYVEYEKNKYEHRERMQKEDKLRKKEVMLIKERKRLAHKVVTNNKKEIFAKIDQEVTDTLKDLRRDINYVDIFLLTKQKILKEKYNINWKIPKVRNKKDVIHSPYY